MTRHKDPKLLEEEIVLLRERMAELEEEVIQLKEVNRPRNWEPPVEFGLTPKEATVLAILYKSGNDITSRERFLSLMYSNEHESPEPKVIDVFICKIRKKLKPYGIEVLTEHGRGHRLSAKSIEVLKNL